MWRIGYALAACFLVALAGLAALWALALVLLHHPALPRSHVISVHDTVGVAQLVFASVAGAGALVALVVAYRRQRVAEASSAQDRLRVFNERFIAIAAQLGDTQPAVRLAGVHAMAGLAEDWTENQQTCVDVLCAYLRLPYDPDDAAEPAERTAYQANREVRHTIIRLIAAHLREGVAWSWEGLNFDFTGVVFDGGDFTTAKFSGGTARFDDAEFSGGTVSFLHTEFSGGFISFAGAEFSGGTTDFLGAKFCGSIVDFSRAKFSGGTVDFRSAEFSGSTELSSGMVDFHGAEFSAGMIDFRSAEFSGSTINYSSAIFTDAQLHFGGAKFSGGTVDFRFPGDWSQPPKFDWAETDPPPAGVMLPDSAGATSRHEPGSATPRQP